MMKGVGEKRQFEYQDGRPLTFQVVGLLSNSMLQGRLLIGESNFETDVSRYQRVSLFLGSRGSVIVRLRSLRILESRLGRYRDGCVGPPAAFCRGMLAVQNTYLRTFQSLGVLGLLLGTIGLAVAQLRSVLERRKELAVMRAIGFSRRRLAAMVMSETAALLLVGIGCGAICAMLAVFPHAILSGLRPPMVEPVAIVAGNHPVRYAGGLDRRASRDSHAAARVVAVGVIRAAFPVN